LNLNHFMGEDFGRTGDLTVLTPITEGVNLKYSVPFLIELRNVPFDQQRQLVFWLLDHLPNFRHAAMDAGGNGSYLAEVASQRYPGRISAVKFSQTWYIENMPKFRSALEDGELDIPQHADVLADLRAIELVNGVPMIPRDRHNRGSDGKPRHGDSAIALALGWYACHVSGAPAAGQIQTQLSPHHQSLHGRRFGRLLS
ncbi:MAG: hypothetical protein K0U93_24070, partial [Gammaproteobacteria bacterium]|nr:hypothetical protein [Gammaproteobacteria bacterium]